ncbi:hypothetical protein MJO28_006821 [Puccinia striiformis f. sp. tritici]|uniref:Uncharacterized protein n=1 Tax=Puccinia striiformis f. sp. tritici TaxID=168172 RepID=A0ACC0EJB0_9BASI|nr:hypothetical protein MJO28_006821 [Puccinia striiformis f. sp. tritici]
MDHLIDPTFLLEDILPLAPPLSALKSPTPRPYLPQRPQQRKRQPARQTSTKGTAPKTKSPAPKRKVKAKETENVKKSDTRAPHNWTLAQEQSLLEIIAEQNSKGLGTDTSNIKSAA